MNPQPQPPESTDYNTLAAAMRQRLLTTLTNQFEGLVALEPGFPLVNENYHRSNTTRGVHKRQPSSPRRWISLSHKLFGAGDFQIAEERFTKGILSYASELKETLSKRPGSRVVNYEVGLALTKDIHGGLHGVHCLVRVSLAGPYKNTSDEASPE